MIEQHKGNALPLESIDIVESGIQSQSAQKNKTPCEKYSSKILAKYRLLYPIRTELFYLQI